MTGSCEDNLAVALPAGSPGGGGGGGDVFLGAANQMTAVNSFIGATYTVTIGEVQDGISPVFITNQTTLLDSGRKVFGTANFGPGIIVSAESVFVEPAETSIAQILEGIAIEPVGAGPPTFLAPGVWFADPVTGNASRTLFATFGVAKDGTTGKEITSVDCNGLHRFELSNCPVFADEAAAIVGGMLTDEIYRTATGELRIKL